MGSQVAIEKVHEHEGLFSKTARGLHTFFENSKKFKSKKYLDTLHKNLKIK